MAIDAVDEVGGGLTMDYAFVDGSVDHSAPPPVPDWLHSRLGIEYFGTPKFIRGWSRPTAAEAERVFALRGLRELQFAYFQEMGDEECVRHLRHLQELRTVGFGRNGVTSHGLLHLHHLKNLERVLIWGGADGVDDSCMPVFKELPKLVDLKLSDTNVSDAGLAELSNCIRLTHLNLDRTQVTDAGLIQIAGLSALKRLSLEGCSITDRGLTHLEGLSELEYLAVGRTGVTAERLAALRRHLPKLEL